MKVGDKVVCIKKGLWTDQLEDEPKGLVFPKYGDELTIRTIQNGFLLFDEIDNSHLNFLIQTSNEISFDPKRFRKRQTNKLSKELAEEFLKKDKQIETDVPERVFNLNAEF